MFLGLPDPDPLSRDTDPDPAPDPNPDILLLCGPAVYFFLANGDLQQRE